MWRATLLAAGAGAALAAPEWVPRGWTAEDGPVEWAGFACFAAAGALLLAGSLRQRNRRALAAAALGGILLLIVAGEEISWGQRLFDVETPAAVAEHNRQDELTLHNLEGVQQRAVVAQLAVAGLGVLAPLLAHAGWARAGFPWFAGYLVYRLGRGLANIAGWGRQGDQAEVSELLLAVGLLATALALLRSARPSEPPA